MSLKMGQSQQLKHSQTLAMTPQLKQAINLLTIPHLEMASYLQKEMIENPFLEEAVEKEITSPKDPLLKVEDELKKWNNAEDERDLDSLHHYLQGQNENYSSRDLSLEDIPSDALPTQEKNLADHLEWQLNAELFTSEEKKLVKLIIYNLNEDGLLEIPFANLLAQTELDEENGLNILHLIQTLDPVGCASANLQEALLIQARYYFPEEALTHTIIKDFFHDWEYQHYQVIATKLNLSLDEVEQAALLIQGLYPRPGQLISNETIRYIIPDAYVLKLGDSLEIQLNEEGVPRLQLSQTLQNLLKQLKKNPDPKVRGYLHEKWQSAIFLIKSLNNRKRTILRVVEAITELQRPFFEEGPKALRPMVLKDVAQLLGVHESTISRATSNKFIHTPHGVFEFKYFFNSSIGLAGHGHLMGSEELKFKIQHLIHQEDPFHPLSDQKIAEIISHEGGVTISRRSITKYREMLNLSPSAKRKKKK